MEAVCGSDARQGRVFIAEEGYYRVSVKTERPDIIDRGNVCEGAVKPRAVS